MYQPPATNTPNECTVDKDDPRWNLGLLRNTVTDRHGMPQRVLLAPCLKSVLERFSFARFHYFEAERLLEQATVGQEDAEDMIALLMWADPKSEEFERTRLYAAAHLTACIQNLHATSDTLAHVIYFALGMNLLTEQHLDERQISMSSVHKKIPEGSLKDTISKLVDHSDYRYFSDLNNYNKHRSLIDTPYSVDFTGKSFPDRGLKFSAFTYAKRQHAERWAAPALKKEYERQDQLINQIGQAINNAAANPGFFTPR